MATLGDADAIDVGAVDADAGSAAGGSGGRRAWAGCVFVCVHGWSG